MSRVISLCLAVALALPAAAEQKKLAVSEIVARRGIDTTLAKVVEEFLVTEIAKTGTYSVIGRDDILRMLSLEEDRIRLTGCADDSCLAEIGGALGVDYLVGGSLDKVGESVLVNLKVLDIRKATVTARDGERLKGATEEDVLDGVTALFERLFGPQGAMVKATEPAAAAEPGTDATLTAEDEPSSGRVWTWVAGGVGLALVGTGIGMLVVAGQKDDDAHKLADDAQPPYQVTYSQIKGAEDEAALSQTVGLVCASVGGAALIAGVVLFFLEDAGEAPATAVAPWIDHDAAGVSAAFRF